MPKAMPKRGISKSKLAMYLRTKCDRELYLSLFSNRPKDLAAASIPIPLKSRPGVQLITASGQQFEYEQYDQLVSSIPSHVVHKNNGRAPLDLGESLDALDAPALLLQPQIEPEEFREFAFGNLGIPPETRFTFRSCQGSGPTFSSSRRRERLSTRSCPMARANGSAAAMSGFRSVSST